MTERDGAEDSTMTAMDGLCSGWTGVARATVLGEELAITAGGGGSRTPSTTLNDFVEVLDICGDREGVSDEDGVSEAKGALLKLKVGVWEGEKDLLLVWVVLADGSLDCSVLVMDSLGLEVPAARAVFVDDSLGIGFELSEGKGGVEAVGVGVEETGGEGVTEGVEVKLMEEVGDVLGFADNVELEVGELLKEIEGVVEGESETVGEEEKV